MPAAKAHMAKAKRLKVYQAPFGFHESVVAAPNQTAALRAWGSHQNLFAEGLAHETDDPDAIEAALAHPEVPLRRAIGSTDPFALEAKTLPKVPDAPKAARPAKEPAKPAEPKPPPLPDRTALDAAEAALAQMEQDRRREEDSFNRRWDALHREQEDARRAYEAAKDKAETGLKAARRAYEKAGGR